MSGPVRLVGYVALLVTPAALLPGAVRAPPDLSIGLLTVPFGVTLAGTVIAEIERQRLSHIDAVGLNQTATVDALAVATAAVVTYGLSVHTGLGPVRASALVGLAVGLVLPRVDGAAYCGSFVGMSSTDRFETLGQIVGAGLVCELIYVVVAPAFAGAGGKLGTTRSSPVSPSPAGSSCRPWCARAPVGLRWIGPSSSS